MSLPCGSLAGNTAIGMGGTLTPGLYDTCAVSGGLVSPPSGGDVQMTVYNHADTNIWVSPSSYVVPGIAIGGGVGRSFTNVLCPPNGEWYSNGNSNPDAGDSHEDGLMSESYDYPQCFDGSNFLNTGYNVDCRANTSVMSDGVTPMRYMGDPGSCIILNTVMTSTALQEMYQLVTDPSSLYYVGTGNVGTGTPVPAWIQDQLALSPSVGKTIATTNNRNPIAYPSCSTNTISPQGLIGFNYTCPPETWGGNLQPEGTNVSSSTLLTAAIAVGTTCSASSSIDEMWSSQYGPCPTFLSSSRIRDGITSNGNNVGWVALNQAGKSLLTGSSAVPIYSSTHQEAIASMLSFGNVYPGALSSTLTEACSTVSRAEIADIYNKYSTDATSMKGIPLNLQNLITACSCNMPSAEYPFLSADLTVTCDPLCNLNTTNVKPAVHSSGDTWEAQPQCTQSVCIVDDVTVTAAGGQANLNINMLCPNTSSTKATAMCYIDGIILSSTVHAELNQRCGTCFTGAAVQYPCGDPGAINGNTPDGGEVSSWESFKTWVNDHVWAAVVLGILFVAMAILLIVVMARARKFGATKNAGSAGALPTATKLTSVGALNTTSVAKSSMTR